MTTIFEDSRGYAIIGIAKKEIFFAKYLVPEGTDNFAEVEPVNGSAKLTPRVDVIAVVEGLHTSRCGCKHVRFIRPDRRAEGARGLTFVEPKTWPRMRAALRHAGIPTLHAPGGFNEVVVGYSDEVAVADYSMAGSHGWIIIREKIPEYLDALPVLQDSGEVGSLFLEQVGWINTPDECSLRLSKEDPTEELPLSYYDRGRGCNVSSNRIIFRVEFDKGSRLVKKIELTSGEEMDKVCYKVHPVQRYISLGRRLPREIEV